MPPRTESGTIGKTYVYEIIAEESSWLILGQKQGTFYDSEAEIKQEVHIVPLRKGQLLLPSVDIRSDVHDDNSRVSVESVSYDASVMVRARDQEYDYFL